ncbi:peptidoglycan/LPS O-acetylase OafA/YrhL [Pseudomonas duriflava]|uniref:Peptidoglycan/LPS O-acetylase OafA/YrhL n=1 Tax=Pseudomonas duriflava TaxID=459528 RepID=A0A562QN32_9PSED|nr:acyltransferase [Pseudomonas duriflava]TWI57610.1 peptidoglycan/LPS O-acetylase OafA/YrhL [Pseudomonas duriflava]
MNTHHRTTHINNFDFLRLLAASFVIFGHMYWLTGRVADEPFLQLTGHSDLADIGVDIFFTISGFLIAGSYLRTSSRAHFVIKRALRILPGLLVATLFTVFVVGALATTLPLTVYLSDELTATYLLNALLLTRYLLPGVFADNPYSHIVNGSLWTLPFEALMYSSIMILGMIKLLKKYAVVGVFLLLAIGHFLVIPSLETESHTLTKLFRLGLDFFSGSVLYLYKDKIIWSWRIALGLGLISLATLGHDAWFIIHALSIPYIALCFAQAKTPYLCNAGRYGDFSYGLYIFGFPIQQLLVMWLGAHTNMAVLIGLSFALTLGLAALSWHFVEAPAMRLKTRWAAPGLPVSAGTRKVS